MLVLSIHFMCSYVLFELKNDAKNEAVPLGSQLTARRRIQGREQFENST